MLVERALRATLAAIGEWRWATRATSVHFINDECFIESNDQSIASHCCCFLRLHSASNRMTGNSLSFSMPPSSSSAAASSLLDYTDIDQGLNLWSEIFPMIEKEIVTLTAVAQEMQECPGNERKNRLAHLTVLIRYRSFS